MKVTAIHGTKLQDITENTQSQDPADEVKKSVKSNLEPKPTIDEIVADVAPHGTVTGQVDTRPNDPTKESLIIVEN